MSMSHLYGRRGEEEEEGVEIESFEVTDWDIANEFNPDRRRHRQTKEQATYGIWADRDSDEDERPSFGGKRSKDYSAPVNFVSAGLRKGAAEEKQQQRGEGSNDSDDDAPSAPSPPRSIAPKKLQMQGNFRGNQSQRFAGGIQSGQGIGTWEKHTKGIGQKLLQKMGYQPGKGLGKNAQGIVNPIEAKVRKGKGAVGAYGNERTQQSLQDFPVVDSDEEEEKEFQKELGQWRKDPAGSAGKKKPKYSYKTVDELKAKGKLAGRSTAASAGELAQVKVIDMTGREQKIYYSYSQMSSKHSVPDEGPPSMSTRDQKGSGFALPELEHNLQLLIDLTEQDILQSARRLQHEKDVVVSLSHESRALQSRLDAEQDAIQKMEAVLALVDRFPSGETAPGEGPTLQECARIFETLQTDYYEEYKTMGLADLATAVVHPLLKEKLRSWDPLKDSSYCLEDIGQWRAILESRDLHSSAPDSNMDPYHRLLWEVWIPVMRSCVSGWQPRMVGPMVDCVEVWAPLIPLWILDHLLEQLILPRLQREAKHTLSTLSSGMGGYMQPGARENIAYLTQTERRKDFQYEAMQERRDAESVAHRGISAGVPTNFKDLIQTKAEENNIVFMPLVAKRHEGKQLYTFGRIVIYIDRGVVFVQGEKTWVPTSLQSLIDMAK
ncbi:tuftelin-interacting protein 11 [Seriola lalandi dorsalis]|nr:tuftelin-interacting protein 11 [Seriola lalandi dorsalis]